MIVFIWFVLAGLERFAVEFLRRNNPVVLGLTQAQLLSLAMIAVGAVGLAFLWSNKDASRPADVPVAARP
jgi:prolipoprotein diacylglyceryltransferase